MSRWLYVTSALQLNAAVHSNTEARCQAFLHMAFTQWSSFALAGRTVLCCSHTHILCMKVIPPLRRTVNTTTVNPWRSSFACTHHGRLFKPILGPTVDGRPCGELQLDPKVCGVLLGLDHQRFLGPTVQEHHRGASHHLHTLTQRPQGRVWSQDLVQWLQGGEVQACCEGLLSYVGSKRGPQSTWASSFVPTTHMVSHMYR